MPVIAASSAEAGRCQQRFLVVLLRRVVGIRCQFSPKLGPVQPLFFFFTLLYFTSASRSCPVFSLSPISRYERSMIIQLVGHVVCRGSAQCRLVYHLIGSQDIHTHTRLTALFPGLPR